MLPTYVSVDPSLYDAASDGDIIVAASGAFSDVSVVFDGASYKRTVPAIAADHPAAAREMVDLATGQATDWIDLPASVSVRSERFVAWHNHLFLEADGLQHFDEFMRPPDRTIWTPETGRLAEALGTAATLEEDCVFLGSAGSKNYGHFIVDDLARLAGAARDVTVVMIPWAKASKRVRREAVSELGLPGVHRAPYGARLDEGDASESRFSINPSQLDWLLSP